MEKVIKRVDAFLSNLGYCSRKDSKKFMKMNEVTINGERIFNPAQKVNHADIKINDEQIDPLTLTILMNKPKEVICSHDDAGVLIYSKLPHRWLCRNPQISTIGRLDVDTTGAILLTDDGKLNHRLSSPRSNVSKVYEVTLAHELKGDEIDIFSSGELILKSEDKPLLPAKMQILDSKKVRLEICEGKYHQVKRMFAAVGNRVVGLHRVSFDIYDVEDLEEGEYKIININS